ncbi:MAG: NAD(P)/FAD-dependent oxidoreductase, partial [Verrucomicrobiota bacterium]
IGKWREGAELAPLLEKHNRDFSTSYQRMFGALYRDKYEYLGDLDLLRVAFRLDIANYYLYVARFLFQKGPQMLEQPPFSPWQAGPFFSLMALYNRRLAEMARERRRRGVFGRNNRGQRDLVPGFNFRLGQLFRTVLDGFAIWAALEITEGWRTWFHRAKKSVPADCAEALEGAPRPLAAQS